MNPQYIFLWRNKKNISTVLLKKKCLILSLEYVKLFNLINMYLLFGLNKAHIEG